MGEAKADQGAGILILPSIGSASCAVHVPQELRAHGLVVWVLKREVHEHRLAGGIQLRIKICALHVDEADLLAFRR